MIDFLLSMLKWSGIIIVALILIGVLIEQFCRWRLERLMDRDLTYIERNGHAIHYVKKGQGKGTVVFLSGMGSSHAIWHDIQDRVAESAVTLSYDRSGIQFSDGAKERVTNLQVSNELHDLLEKIDCPKPFILVAHSMAAIYMRPFVAQHRDDIAGILLVEGAHPLQKIHASAQLKTLLRTPSPWLIRFAVHSGLYRCMFSFLPISQEIPFGHPLHVRERDFFYRSVETTLDELQQDSFNFKDALQRPDFGDIPLMVLAGTSDIRYAGIKDKQLAAEYKRWVIEHQYAQLALSTDSRFIEASKSGHLVQIHDADLIINCVESLLPFRGESK
ncbi:alpha/beta fold hydrolase [Sphingobacterium pedocola]|uniref:AB hydrolase-1 domain-containing protein n=1 Tax=Sphingobacterium pedocola TaxID=2082722 RepID=A0ABR9TBD0_9SPHI|nr:alpha/beta hydrolase [Sphingobacterium pedocola]MBE8722672.1 hypothetical protein [Sphingobacterium pedocola]